MSQCLSEVILCPQSIHSQLYVCLPSSSAIDAEGEEETIDISEDEIKGIISEVLNGKIGKLADTLKKEVSDNFKKMTGKVM